MQKEIFPTPPTPQLSYFIEGTANIKIQECMAFSRIIYFLNSENCWPGKLFILYFSSEKNTTENIIQAYAFSHMYAHGNKCQSNSLSATLLKLKKNPRL